MEPRAYFHLQDRPRLAWDASPGNEVLGTLPRLIVFLPMSSVFVRFF